MGRSSLAELQSCTNFRDVGGARTPGGRVVASGRLYRCDSLHKLCEEEARQFAKTHAPRTILDLRSAEEVLRFGAGPLAKGVHHLHLPIGTEAPGAMRRRRAPSLVDLYTRFAEHSGLVVAEIVRVLGSRHVLPTIVFCAAGKDRTGVTIALVLGALNVTDRDVVADYATTRVVDPALLGDGYAQRFADLPAAYREAAPQTMRGFLAAIRRKYGSIRAYMAHYGVERVELRDLERALLVQD